MKARTTALIVACTLLLVALAGVSALLWSTRARLESADDSLQQTREAAVEITRRSGWSFAVFTGQLSSIEPSSDAALLGVYRAKLVGVDPGGKLKFDWLGYVPDPHATRLSNQSSHVQLLSADPFSSVALVDRRLEGSPKPLIWVATPDVIKSLRSQDATGKAMLQSEWWVGVRGNQWLSLVQAQ